ncbi:MAG: HD domain-containing protein, partial [Desulfosarcina sp.]
AAARVHDVARLEKNHAAAGARLLQEMGFSAMAAIVAVHMELSVTAASPLDEAQIVYLADKLVTGNKVAGLTQRFDAALKKHGRDPQAAEAIQQRWQAARTIEAKVAEVSGGPLDHLLINAGIIRDTDGWNRPDA